MNQLESSYIEQYKKVDALLCSRFDVRNGMTEYIDRMDAADEHDRLLVPSWRMYYRSLKHLRWLRNRIVHDEGVSECESFNLAELKDFYRKLQQEEDPLSVLENLLAAQKSAAQRAVPAPAAPRVTQQPDEYRSADSGGWLIPVLIIAIVTAFFIIASSILIK